MIMNMKKYILLLSLSALALTSCYDSYIHDNADAAVGFANQNDVRSVVVGESLEFSTGVALAGVIDNKEDRTVGYTVDAALVNEETLNAFKAHPLSYINSLYAGVSGIVPLAEDAYTLVNDGDGAGKTVIKAGTHLGKITVKVNPDKYFSGQASTTPTAVIALSITDAGKLDVIEGKATTVIGVRFENMLFGNYWHGGVATVEGPDGTRTETFATTIPQPDNSVWTLTTETPHTLTANAVGNELNGTKAQLRLTVDEDSGAVTVSAVEGATYVVEPDGECRFNQARLLQDRKIFLSYKYVKAGETWHVKDTLTFRNRIRDGVNEWQDENQEAYQ